MSVSLTGTGGWFTRSGAYAGEFNRVAGVFYGSALDAGFSAIWAQYASADQAAVQGLPDAVSAFRNTDQTYLGVLSAEATLSSLLQVSRDTSVVPYTAVQSYTVLRSQMLALSESINRPTLTNVVSPGGANIGDTNVFASTTNIYGDPLDSTFNETFAVTCTAGGSGTTFTATLGAVGTAAVPTNAYNWPQGSGASTSISVADPASSGIVTDGGFAQWTGTGSNTPVAWAIVDGSPGVTVFRGTGLGVRDGTDAAKIVSDGSQSTQLAQTISVSPNTVYCVTVQAKVSATDGSGTMFIQLTDGDGVVLDDDAGNALTVSLGMTMGPGQFVSTNYSCFAAFFSTPRQLPASVKVEIGFGTPPTAAKYLLIDLAQVIVPTPLYGASGTGASGPWLAAIAGTLPSAAGDVYTVQFENSLTNQSFVWGLERLLGLRASGVYFPSSVSPTISDSLVTH